MKRLARTSFLKWIFLLSLWAALAGCGLLPETNAPPPQPLRIEFTEWWGDYTLVIAQQQGFFQKHGVPVELVYYPLYSRALSDLAARRIDGGLLSIGDAISVSKYTDVKVVAVYDNGSYNTIVSIPEITRIRDLTGKRIGVQIGSTYELLISDMLASVGMSLSDVTLVNVAPEDIPANLGQTIEAGFVYEPYTSFALERGNNLLLKSQEFVGLYPDVIVFHSAIVNERPQDIRAFLRAWFEAVEFRRQNPAEARQTIANYFQEPLAEIRPDEGLEIFNLEDNYDLFSAQPTRKRSIYQTAQLNADFLVRIGVLPAQPNLNALLTPEYLP